MRAPLTDQDLVKLQEEIQGWTYFHFTLCVLHEFPDVDRSKIEQLSDKQMAEHMIDLAVQHRRPMQSALWDARWAIERQYRGVDDAMVGSAFDELHKLIEERKAALS